jgi:curli biogenesis system outer membrane secretion channel CsgG
MVRLGRFLATTAAVSLVATTAFAQYGMDKKQPSGTPDIRHCDRPVGTVSIQEPEHKWWTQYGLASPEALIKLYASRSNCLRVVDRNGGLAMRNVERGLGSSGELQRGSNVGAGQVKAADYALIPDITDANSNAGGAGGALGGLLPGRAGALLGAVKTKRSEARVLLTLVNIRTTEQEYVAEGSAQKTNVSFAGGGWGPDLAGIGGGYSNTDEGLVISAAYLNAFNDMVDHLRGVSPGDAAAAAPIQTYVAKRPIQLHASASPSSKVIRSFAVGDSVFPTGQKNGVWWEVDDENGNRGWVTSVAIGPK